MYSLKAMIKKRIFYVFIMVMISIIFILNIAFFLFATIHYDLEVQREYESLHEMIAHLFREENPEVLMSYLEHYTHNHVVIITLFDAQENLVFTNDLQGVLNTFDDVYDGSLFVGQLSASYETSTFGREYVLGFIFINIASIMTFFTGIFFVKSEH